MNRRIKFRAWEEDVKFMNDCVLITKLSEKTFFQVSEGFGWKDVPEKHVMQYTGLKDGNGKDIYEGDIVERVEDTPFRSEDGTLKYCSWMVEFKYDGWMFVDTPISPATSYPAFYSNAKYMKIVGNIYQNPEFLEVES